MKITWKPFEHEHLRLLELRDHEKLVFDTSEKLESLVYGTQFCWTMFRGDQCIGVMGYFILWEGVLEVFLIPTVYTKDNPLPFQRQIKDWLKWLFANTGAHRLQTLSVADGSDSLDGPTDRWMRSIGFKHEGTLRQYTSGKLDYRQWARLSDGRTGSTSV